MYYALSAAVLLLLAWFFRNDAADYAAFKALADTDARQRTIRRWTGRAFAFLFVGGVIVLLLIGRIDALWRMPSEFAPLGATVERTISGGGDGRGHFLLVICGGLLGGAVGGAVIAAVSKTRKGPGAAPPLAGDIEPLLPRNAAERRWTALLAANAGPSEEIVFRLMLPLVLTLATGRPLLAFAIAGLVFGLVHFYQGWIGIAATTLLGTLLAAVYLASGTIWTAVLLHSLLNLATLWLRPWLAALAERRLSA
jgi:membrane protease YdiL (CAAX protease family)